MIPAWASKGLLKPGTKGFSSLPGEAKLAASLREGARARPNSGAGPAKYDVASKSWLLDKKETTARSHSISRKALHALTLRSLREGRKPAYVIEFWDEECPGETWVLVRKCDWDG